METPSTFARDVILTLLPIPSAQNLTPFVTLSGAGPHPVCGNPSNFFELGKNVCFLCYLVQIPPNEVKVTVSWVRENEGCGGSAAAGDAGAGKLRSPKFVVESGRAMRTLVPVAAARSRYGAIDNVKLCLTFVHPKRQSVGSNSGTRVEICW